ncbi:unnamed protein product [Phytophthora fragariaefolia]|uniref:Unnamed protein product n=1 Tax=Phytophthora fragariaefolia TaxID=1490495 RepID=A0A9W6Y1X3_9STRA|nr:unnamed protein product [Phytophthora fragariaefolia]
MSGPARVLRPVRPPPLGKSAACIAALKKRGEYEDDEGDEAHEEEREKEKSKGKKGRAKASPSPVRSTAQYATHYKIDFTTCLVCYRSYMGTFMIFYRSLVMEDGGGLQEAKQAGVTDEPVSALTVDGGMDSEVEGDSSDCRSWYMDAHEFGDEGTEEEDNVGMEDKSWNHFSWSYLTTATLLTTPYPLIRLSL